MVLSGWSISTMPSAPITRPSPSLNGTRLTRKVPAWLVSRSTMIGRPVSITWASKVLGTTASTGLPTNCVASSKPSAGRKRL